MNRAELLELLIAQTERADKLSAELEELKEQIKSREKLINQAGDLAYAATRLLQALEIEPINVHEAAGVSQRKSQILVHEQVKGSKYETKGIDISAIATITSGIGKGEI